MKLSLSLKEECEARMKRSSTRDGSSKKHHLRRRHRSTSSSSSSSRSSSRRRRSRSKSSSRSHGSRSHRRPKHSSRRRSHSRSGSDRSFDQRDRFGRRINPTNVTNSKDPKAVASRIFLGSLPPDLLREDVDARFSKYGKIQGITLLQGFGFVQFEEEGEAIRAVHTENGMELKGSKIDVRLASEHKKNRGSIQGDDSGHRKHSSRDLDYPPRPFPPPPPPRDPYAEQYGLPPPHLDPYHRPPHPGHPADPYARGPPLPPPHGDPYHRGPPLPPYHRGPPHPDDPYVRGPPFDPYARGPLPPGDPYRRPPYAEPYPYHGPGSSYGPPAPPPPSVDCEIIVLDEKQRSYADSIKKRLMSAGVVTEMNILPPAIDILVALEEATRRHLLFAIIVNDQNEIHRSITVNILHGLTQEHRNMPVDDAITLVTRSFDKYMLEKQEKISMKEAEDGVAKRAPDFLRPTANTLYMLNLLADNRYLTVDELDTVLDYLQLRRDRLVKNLGGGGGGGGAAVARSVGPTTPPPPIKKVKVEDVGPSGVGGIPLEPDMKSILGLLQKEKTASIEAAAKPVSSYNTTSLSSASSSALSSTSINFNNAAVQQALDNLINSGPNLLKSLKDAGKTPPAAVAPTASRSYSDEGTVDPYEDFERSYAAGQQYRGGAY